MNSAPADATGRIHRSARLLGWVVVAAAIAWGLRLVILEGFVYEWTPSGFDGDFQAMMFRPDLYWDGQGIAYGPIFVIERWLVDAAPRVFSVATFAVANIFLAIGAFYCCVRSCRLTPGSIALSLALWLCCTNLYYAFSVSANPEFLELFLLSAAWLAATHATEAWEGSLIAVAGLTKLFPWLFAIPLVVRRSRRGLLALTCVGAVVVTVVSVGQRLAPWDVVVQGVFNRIRSSRGDVTNYSEFVLKPASQSRQWQGVLEALARRLFGAPQHVLTPTDLLILRTSFIGILLTAIGLALWSAIRLPRAEGLQAETRIILAYSLYFCLMPILTIFAHPHTFVFLLPLWVSLPRLIVVESATLRRRWLFGIWFGCCYVLTGFPQPFVVIDRALGTTTLKSWAVHEPMIGTMLLAIGVAVYAKSMMSRTPAMA